MKGAESNGEQRAHSQYTHRNGCAVGSSAQSVKRETRFVGRRLRTSDIRRVQLLICCKFPLSRSNLIGL